MTHASRRFAADNFELVEFQSRKSQFETETRFVNEFLQLRQAR